MKRSEARSERRRKLHIARLIITELIIMAVEVVCFILPTPWRVGVLLFIGARSILIKARMQLKKPVAPEVVHYCTASEHIPNKELKNETENKAKQSIKKNGKKAAGKRG